MSPWLLRLFVVVLCSLSLLAARNKNSKDPAFAQINSIVKSVSGISGLTEEHTVPYARMSKRQLRQFLAKRIKKSLRPEEIHADELALKMFGLVPQTFDLKKSTIDLLTEQAAAFYDYDDKKLFLLEDSSVSAEVTTLAHELSHALADQHFDLQKYMDQSPANDDENLAHTAVVEGQASWLMIAYDLEQAGQPAVPTAAALKTVVDSSESSMGDYPVLKGSPLYIQQSLMFPYTDGTTFFDAVYKKNGKAAFTEVFKDPPSDSAQILHPDRYFAHIKATKPALPKLASRGGEHEISEGSVGEFDHEILLRQYTSKAESRSLAPHLRGGSFKIVDVDKQHRPVLLYASEWDSTEQASEFFKDYKKVLHSKWRRCNVAVDKAHEIAGLGDNGYFVAKLEGTVVSSMEGLGNENEWDQQKTESRPAARPVASGSQSTLFVR